MKYELQMWVFSFFSLVPGNIGCYLRKIFLPCGMGNNSKIWNGVHIDKPSNLLMGENVSINRGTLIHAGGGVEIGNDTLIGPGVVIYSQNHNFDNQSMLIREQGYCLKKVVIGENVWIACRAVILPGVTVGPGAVVAAGSVVSKDVSANTLVAGVPAKVVRYLNEKSDEGDKSS